MDYPLPGVGDAARHLFFTNPERVSPIFAVDGEDVTAGFETKTHFLVREQRFGAVRPEGGIRVAFLGGSSVQGWPFREPGGSFPDLVGERLRERFPDRPVDVVNAGVGGYNSFQLVDVAHQIAPLQVDVVVIYAGHNDQGYYAFQTEYLAQQAGTGADAGFVRRLERPLNRLNFFRAARRFRDRGAPAPEPGESSPQGDDTFRPSADQRDLLGPERFEAFAAAHAELVPTMLERNLRELIALLDDEDTDVVLAIPASNLRDQVPEENLHRPPLDDAAAAQFADLMTEAEAAMEAWGVAPRKMPPVPERWLRFADPVDVRPRLGALPVGSDEAVAACAEPLARLDEAAAISDTWAHLWFLRGTCLLHSDPTAAARAFRRARDLCPALPPHQRAWSPVQEAVRRAGRGAGVPVVDTPAVLAEAAELGIPGGEFFVDNLHFSGRGAAVVADAVADAVGRLPALTTGPAPSRPPDPPPSQLGAQLVTASLRHNVAQGLTMPGSAALVIGPEESPEPDPCAEPALEGRLDPAAEPTAGLYVEVESGDQLTMRLDGPPELTWEIRDLAGEVSEGDLRRPVAEWTAPGAGAFVIRIDGSALTEPGPYSLCLQGGGLRQRD